MAERCVLFVCVSHISVHVPYSCVCMRLFIGPSLFAGICMCIIWLRCTFWCKFVLICMCAICLFLLWGGLRSLFHRLWMRLILCRSAAASVPSSWVVEASDCSGRAARRTTPLLSCLCQSPKRYYDKSFFLDEGSPLPKHLHLHCWDWEGANKEADVEGKM